MLNGLRGMAALLVVFYHIFEGLSFATGWISDNRNNYSYLYVKYKTFKFII